MKFRTVVSALIVPALAVACSSGPDETGPVTISIQQSLTGQTTAAGTFQMTGTLTDTGQTTESLTFLGPLDKSPVPVSFTRQLTGARGALSVKGNATLTFTSPTAATVSGDWEVESGTGAYASMKGTGRLTGTADFGAAPPTAALSMAGSLLR